MYENYLQASISILQTFRYFLPLQSLVLIFPYIQKKFLELLTRAEKLLHTAYNC